MRTHPVLVLIALCACLCACGHSSADIDRSRTVAYNAEFAAVWKAAFTEVSEHYNGQIVKAVPQDGFIVSNWKMVEAQRDTTVGTSRSPASENVKSLGGTFFRHVVRLVGKDGQAPYYVLVDGEAALYQPGNAVLIPFPHGAPDEPGWVPGRIDELRAAIYKRLAPYAVEAGPPPADLTASKVPGGSLVPPASNAPNPPATPIIH